MNLLIYLFNPNVFQRSPMILDKRQLLLAIKGKPFRKDDNFSDDFNRYISGFSCFWDDLIGQNRFGKLLLSL
jgi:hypothetical protein